MSQSKYLTAPLSIETMPPGVPYIIGNEAAERFCFYGMKTILVVFMTKFLLDRHGNLTPMSDEEAKGYYHLFVAGVYFFPIIEGSSPTPCGASFARSSISRWSIAWAISPWPPTKRGSACCWGCC